MEESWETGFAQYPDRDDAREFQDYRTMMHCAEARSSIFIGFGSSLVGNYIILSSKNQRERHNADKSKNKRRSLEVENHIMAERRRRQQITEKFTALSAIIPGLKKLDKETILDEAIKYVKHLQERVRELEKGPSLTPIKRIEFYENDHNFYEVNEVLPSIEVRVSENKQGFVRIYCEKHKGIEFKILSLLEDFHLCVTSTSILPFGKSTLGITIIAQVGDEYNTPVNEVVKNLRQILLKSPS